jgi:hypothetical protein
MNQVVEDLGGDVDETTRALLHQDFHNLLLSEFCLFQAESMC